MFFSLWIGLAGCGDSPLKGQVVNVTGQGIAGVNVQVADSTCATQSDTNGEYTLKCLPSAWTIQFSKEGFVPSQVVFDATKEGAGEIPSQKMIAVPPEQGLFIEKDGAYHSLPTGTLTRSMQKSVGQLERRYCLQTTEKVPMELPTTMDVYDHGSKPWRLFLLNEDRCAYTDTRSASGRWSVGYRNKPQVRVQELGSNLSLTQADLEPGQYFIAYWDGFFVQTDDDSPQYSGYWFQVEG